MDINKLIDRIKIRLGIFYFKLPISDDDLMNVIKIDTLVSFSNYFPYNLNLPVKISDENKVADMQFAYYIDTTMLQDEMQILGLADVNYNNFRGQFGDRFIMYNGPSDFMMMQSGLNMQAVMNIPIIPEFISPNIVQFDEDIRGYYYDYTAQLLTTHSPTLATIPPAYNDEFFKLALIDIKIFLYNNLKHFDNIDTTFGNISLKIDEWSNADDERATLLSAWDEKYIYALDKKIYNV